MRRLLCLFVLAPVGCCSPCSTGWRFEVLKPPTLNGAALVNQGATPLGVAGLASGAVLHEVAAIGPAPPAIAGRPLLAAPTPSCTLDDVCRRLEALEQRSLPGPRRELLPAPTPARPMPRGEATPASLD